MRGYVPYTFYHLVDVSYQWPVRIFWKVPRIGKLADQEGVVSWVTIYKACKEAIQWNGQSNLGAAIGITSRFTGIFVGLERHRQETTELVA